MQNILEAITDILDGCAKTKVLARIEKQVKKEFIKKAKTARPEKTDDEILKAIDTVSRLVMGRSAISTEAENRYQQLKEFIETNIIKD